MSNSEVVIQVEKQACVKIVFKTEDGAVLEDAGYEEYYGKIGAGLVSVHAPDGYKIVGDDRYAVDVTRDKDGNLVADPAEISFTVKADVFPSDYFFTVRYVDAAGNPVPGGGKQYFDATGKVSREDIPMPYGYQAANIPAHPGDEWLNPTALEFIDGVWKVTNPVVTIEVEKQACVKIVFKTEGGTVLQDAGYEEYFGEIGAGLISVQAPEGYEIVGDDSYAVDVTRDNDENLVADPVEVVFVVKKVGAANPSNPDPSQPEQPSKPEQAQPSTPAQPGDKDIPNTGDSGTPILPLMVLMIVSGGILVVTLKKRKFHV